MRFAVTVWHESPAQVTQVLESIRGPYPSAPVTLVGDGPRRADVAAVATRFGCQYRWHGLRTKVPERGHRYVAGWMEALLEGDDDVLIKVDPDTVIHRPFRHLPDADLFGQRAGKDHILACCIGVRRPLVERAHRDGLWTPYPHARYRKGWSEEQYLRRWVRIVGARVAHWPETWARLTHCRDPLRVLPPPSPHHQAVFAATHPHVIRSQ